MTEHIAYENGMVICIESYFCQKPTHLIVEALEPCVLWNIPHDYIEDLETGIMKCPIFIGK